MNMENCVVQVALTPFTDSQDISFDNLNFAHVGCSNAFMATQRDVVSSNYTI